MDQLTSFYVGFIKQNAPYLGGAPIEDDRQIRVEPAGNLNKLSMQNLTESAKRDSYIRQQRERGQDAVTYDVFTKVNDYSAYRALQAMTFMDKAYDGGESKTIQLAPDTFVIVSHHSSTNIPISAQVDKAISKAVPALWSVVV